MKYIALKELPQGQQPGEVFDATEAIGAVLILVGAAKRADQSSTPVTDADAPRLPRGRYRRADLRADSSDPVAES